MLVNEMMAEEIKSQKLQRDTHKPLRFFAEPLPGCGFIWKSSGFLYKPLQVIINFISNVQVEGRQVALIL